MKKLLLLFALTSFIFFSCEKEDVEIEKEKKETTNEETDESGDTISKTIDFNGTLYVSPVDNSNLRAAPPESAVCGKINYYLRRMSDSLFNKASNLIDPACLAGCTIAIVYIHNR